MNKPNDLVDDYNATYAPQPEKTEEAKRERRREKRLRLEKAFWREICKRLFVLVMIFAVAFAVLDLSPRGTTAPLVQIFFSLMLGTALPGVPLLLICIVQLVRIQKKKIEETPRLYQVLGGITLVLLLGWLIVWLVAG